ncbi:ribulose-phosphate 3-epimerase [Brevinema andersonii]|uniref:Ribulose-phosphate 3-epimerase n=1 Tax=Brevinema andersonii TaxID=34097 RepID=A0A1I1D8U7_BREAD|nr:ribulose-phosphate 3-epimerase [Brevinema andersonii]SFB68973.1 ribulose-phosphate 3-epimerase [Brevinema andersonii]
MEQINILPSIFAANFADIPSALELIRNSSITMIHYDVMDNHFVPNISFGEQFVKQVMSAVPEIQADIHLMIDLPGHYEKFLALKPRVLTIHAEASENIIPYLRGVRSEGILAGVSLKPDTPIDILKDLAGEFDLFLVMSVEPGFSFQKFIPRSLQKIQQARSFFGENLIIEADGGINRQNMHILKEAGLNWFVMGGGFFNDPSPDTLLFSLNNDSCSKE